MVVFNALTLWASVALTLALFAALFVSLHWRQQTQMQQHVDRNIAQLRTLRNVVGGLQRHRGLSNGVLCGDHSLSQDLSNTRQTLNTHFQAVQTLHTSQTDRWESLIDHWSRLRCATSGTPANNLSQHHLIIRNAIFLMEDVASEHDLTQGRPELSYLPCIWREILQAAEWAGQARALGTGMAAARASNPEQRVRLRFLHQKLQIMAASAFSTLTHHAHKYPSQADLGLSTCEPAVQELLQCIDQELLTNRRLAISATDYFQRATLAIDGLLGLVDAALQALTATDVTPRT